MRSPEYRQTPRQAAPLGRWDLFYRQCCSGRDLRDLHTYVAAGMTCIQAVHPCCACACVQRWHWHGPGCERALGLKSLQPWPFVRSGREAARGRSGLACRPWSCLVQWLTGWGREARGAACSCVTRNALTGAHWSMLYVAVCLARLLVESERLGGWGGMCGTCRAHIGVYVATDAAVLYELYMVVGCIVHGGTAQR